MADQVRPDGGNIIAMFDRVGYRTDWLMNAGRLGLVSTLLCSYPLLTHPCRDAALRLVRAAFYGGDDDALQPVKIFAEHFHALGLQSGGAQTLTGHLDSADRISAPLS